MYPRTPAPNFCYHESVLIGRWSPADTVLDQSNETYFAFPGRQLFDM